MVQGGPDVNGPEVRQNVIANMDSENIDLINLQPSPHFNRCIHGNTGYIG